MSQNYSRLHKMDRERVRDERREAKAARKAERKARAPEGCIGHESAEDLTTGMAEATQ